MVACLEKLGVRVHRTNADWDLTCQLGGAPPAILCEVRQANQPRKARKGNQERIQRDFCIKWLQTPDDCLKVAQMLYKWREQAIRYSIDDYPEPKSDG